MSGRQDTARTFSGRRAGLGSRVAAAFRQQVSPIQADSYDPVSPGNRSLRREPNLNMRAMVRLLTGTPETSRRTSAYRSWIAIELPRLGGPRGLDDGAAHAASDKNRIAARD
jgi:hypothetical protein